MVREGESGSDTRWPVPRAGVPAPVMGRGYLRRGISHMEQGWRTHCCYKPSCDPLPSPTKRFPSLMPGRRGKSEVMTLPGAEPAGCKATVSPRTSRATVTAALGSGCPGKRGAAPGGGTAEVADNRGAPGATAAAQNSAAFRNKERPRPRRAVPACTGCASRAARHREQLWNTQQPSGPRQRSPAARE